MSLAAEQLSHEDLLKAYYKQQSKIAELEQRVSWYEKQYFGKKSERILSESSPNQLSLGEGYEPEASAPPQKTKVKEYERSHRKDEVTFRENESRLKFEDTVPVETVVVANPQLEGLSPDEYEVIGEEITHKLAQRPSAHVVLRYVRQKVKLKESGAISVAPVTPAASVIERSVAEVSFIVGLILDKFLYHLPLYRQHQRLTASGIHINRMTLTNLVHRAAQLLEPIYVSLQSSILLSKVLALDETPLKAGRKVKGKMHQGYLWCMYGDRGELAFLYSPSRSGKLITDLLSDFQGTVITDGYRVYERFAEQRRDILHAQCWVHARRKFFDAQESEPVLSEKALKFIAELYRHQDEGAPRSRSKLVVDEFFSWLKEVFQKQALLPSNPFTKAASYALQRESALRVFLDDDSVPLDTNHLERQIRPVAIGRKNWLFHWTETGAQYSAILQSLIATCKLHDIDPYAYLVDVLQRIDSHPMNDIDLLTPRNWKIIFSQDPLTSDLK